MGIYVCWKCSRKFKSEEMAASTSRCPYCGSKVLFKETPPVLKKVRSD